MAVPTAFMALSSEEIHLRRDHRISRRRGAGTGATRAGARAPVLAVPRVAITVLGVAPLVRDDVSPATGVRVSPAARLRPGRLRPVVAARGQTADCHRLWLVHTRRLHAPDNGLNPLTGHPFARCGSMRALPATHACCAVVSPWHVAVSSWTFRLWQSSPALHCPAKAGQAPGRRGLGAAHPPWKVMARRKMYSRKSSLTVRAATVSIHLLGSTSNPKSRLGSIRPSCPMAPPARSARRKLSRIIAMLVGGVRHGVR